MSIENDVYYNELFEEYSALLTDNKRDIFDMHYRLDLSLGEIAEIKGVTRQGVSDCIKSVKKQLEAFEEKLHFREKKNAVYRLIGGLSEENKDIGNEIEKILGE